MVKGQEVSVVWSVSLTNEESEQLEQILSESGLKPGLEGFETLVRQILSGEFGDDEDEDEAPRKPKTDALEQLLRDHGPLIAEGGKLAFEMVKKRLLRPGK